MRAARFERRYPMLIGRGLVALDVVPATLLLALLALPAKFALLICWIISLAATCTYLIVIEYLHERARGVLAGRTGHPRRLATRAGHAGPSAPVHPASLSERS